MTIRCAIIGCGPSTPGKGGAHSISYAHAWAIGRIPELQLVAAASRTPANLDDFRAEFPGCTGYLDYTQMLEREEPQIVAICAYPRDREAMVSAALANGAQAILIEKPMAASLGAARRIMAAADAAGCRLFVHHQRRYGKPFEWWRDAIAGGEIGDLESIDIAQPFDNIMGFGPHLVDAALFALGPRRHPLRVVAALDMAEPGSFQGLPTEKHLLASVHFNDGIRLTIEAGRKVCSRLPVLRANGASGFAELRMEPLDGEGSVFRKLTSGGGLVSPSTNEHFHHSEDGTLYVHRAWVDIHHALATGAATRIDAVEAYRGLEIIMAAFEAGRLAKPLAFPIAQELFPLDL